MTSTYPLRSQEGTIHGVCGVTTDITERKRPEAERSRLQEEVIKAQESTLSSRRLTAPNRSPRSSCLQISRMPAGGSSPGTASPDNERPVSLTDPPKVG